MAERVALITGGAKGIGRGIALDLAAQQWSVAICYRTSESEAESHSRRDHKSWRSCALDSL